MCKKPVDFPIRADDLDLEFLFNFSDELQHIQKTMYPDFENKHLPIRPGNGLTVFNLVLSTLSNLLDTLAPETHDHLSIENEQFRLIFYHK